MWLFPLGAAAVSAAFAAALIGRFLERRRPNLLAWGVALAMFSLASLAAAIAILGNWTTAWFRVYYLFGAIVNVPVLALGTVYLLTPRALAHAAAAVVAAASVVAAALVVSADLNAAALAVDGIPPGAEVVPDSIRALSRYYSYTGFAVVLAGTLWSAWRLMGTTSVHARRFAQANGLIAAGVVVNALAGAFARYGQGTVFAVGLLAGVVVMYLGFLKTQT